MKTKAQYKVKNWNVYDAALKQRGRVLLLKSLNILQFLSPGVMLRDSDPQLQQLKALAVQYRQVIKTYLKLSISEKYTPIAIA
ncbi:MULTISPECIES: hypothetical protein [unclassified Nostoc]|uniref:hypothetical protein n=1 Tax=unclassified Nostoc TaxID=2593658 RepID=UPI002AD327BA|nr:MULTISPECIES: hypothetical protein [unclassified Nostoc]MDZ8125656.1 hypothetical protein [Nostoc sp. CmiVER01]MDZ8221846.1 hypothetical protein [Nostoc sp. ChiVER01]